MESDLELIGRIKALMNEKGDSSNAFAKKVEIDPGNLRKKLKGEYRITKKDLYKISKNLGVSREWLEFGEGEKYCNAGAEHQGSVPQSTVERPSAGVPFYDVDFSLGFGEMYNDEPTVPSRYITVPGYEKADFWCRTSGDSMKPLISNGDIIALKEVTDWQQFLPMNEVYAIMTANDLRTVKIIRKDSDETRLTLHAVNPEYSDQTIPKGTIRKVYKVLGALKAF